jgi:hypothetical protein
VGTPLTLHPWLLHPQESEALAIDDAFYLGRSLYTMPVVRRGVTTKRGWLPPGRFVDIDDLKVFQGGQHVDIPAPLDKLIVLQVEDSMLPLLDESIDTLAPASDPAVVTPADVADRLDVWVVLGAAGSASMTLSDGTQLEATRLSADVGNPQDLQSVAQSQVADCAGCYASGVSGDVRRIQVTTQPGTESELRVEDVQLKVISGPVARRIRWDVRRLE